jgi:hypothetical protein
MPTKECVICNETFTTKKSNAKYCANKCAVAAYRKRHPKRVKANRQRRQNTDEYRAKHNAYEKMRTQRPEVKAKISKRRKKLYLLHKKEKQNEYYDKKFGKPPVVNCKECGNEFQLPYRIRKGGKNIKKYCSKSCKSKYDNRKVLSNPKNAMADRVRRQINHYLGKYRISKGGKTFALLGYSPTDLIKHIESQFVDGMSWENRSDWHIDHIRPVASFNFTTTECEDFKKCWALSNLQPLWAEDNISKSDKWDGVINA